MRVLPGVLAGAFAVEYAITQSAGLSLLLALGNTAEALVGLAIARRAGGLAAFDSLAGVVRFAAATLAGPVVAATVGMGALLAFGEVPAAAAGDVWLTWYLGDAAGGFVVAPVLLLVIRRLRSRPFRLIEEGQPAEAVAIVLGFLAVSALGLGFVPGLAPNPAFLLVFMPAVAWCAYRLGPTMSAALVLGFDTVAILVRRSGTGPFGEVDATSSLLVLQSFMFTLGFMALGLSALAGERRRAAAELERRIEERTRRLETMNTALRRQVEERRQAQAQVDEAQRVAHMGTWRWDVTKPHAEWSPELFRIYGLDPGSHVPTYEDYLTRVHPDDVEKVKAATDGVFRDQRPYSHDERIRRPDGSWRNLHTWAQAVTDRDGKLVALVGACQDITEATQAGRALQESLERFRALAEASPIGIVHTTPFGSVDYANEAWSRITGINDFRDDDLVRKAIHPEDQPRSWELWGKALRDGSPFNDTMRWVHPDGTVRVTSCRAVPVRDAAGALTGFVSTVEDVTERHLAEVALRDSLERFRALADASPIGIVHTTAAGVVDYVNDQWRQITGVHDHTDAEAMRRSVHPEDQPAAAELWRACLREGRDFESDMRFVHPDGAVRWTRARAVPVRDAAGAITGFVSALSDITDQRAAEEKEREVRRLREQAEFKTNFLRTAAHEIGTPLTPIKIQMRILKDLLRADAGARNAEERKAAEILDRNIHRLHVLVTDMLESARLQSGRLKLAPRPIDLAHVVHDVVETFQEPAIETGIALDTSGPAELPAVADPDRISQVLYNLLSNAMKFTPAGGRVHVDLRREPGDRVRVTVQDSGAGFSAEQGERLFQPFTQLHMAAGQPRMGSGLGLYISRGIVEQHGGQLLASSPGPGHGSTFTFTLPRIALPFAAGAADESEGIPGPRGPPPEIPVPKTQPGWPSGKPPSPS